MRIAIISDIHDNLVNLKKCLAWCRKEEIKTILCCGDVTNSETLAYLSDNFSGIIYLIRGNMEIYDEAEVKNYKNIKYLGRYGRVELADKKIGICHEPAFIDKVLGLEECGLVFYGHTHQPWTEAISNVKIYNPGTLGGVFSKATFAYWDVSKAEPELKILENI